EQWRLVGLAIKKIRDQCSSRKFAPVLRACGIARRTAYRYMELAERWDNDKCATVAQMGLGLCDALLYLNEPYQDVHTGQEIQELTSDGYTEQEIQGFTGEDEVALWPWKATRRLYEEQKALHGWRWTFAQFLEARVEDVCNFWSAHHVRVERLFEDM